MILYVFQPSEIPHLSKDQAVNRANSEPNISSALESTALSPVFWGSRSYIGSHDIACDLRQRVNTIFHSNCRGIGVAIPKDEEELPKILGVPQSLRDVNDLIQPKRK